jgi:hypothetical protein
VVWVQLPLLGGPSGLSTLAFGLDLADVTVVLQQFQGSADVIDPRDPCPAAHLGLRLPGSEPHQPLPLSLTLSVILLASKSAADGPPGLQPRDPMLVQEILESGL